MRTISFSVSDEEHGMFRAEAAAKGLSVSAYCKMAAFSHAAKYGSKSFMTEMVKLFEKREKTREKATNVASGGNHGGG